MSLNPMKRRDFIILLGAGTAAWSSDALAQPFPTIGILGSGSRNGAAPYLAALQGGDLGRLRLDQCNQFFPRWLTWRLRIHESLNRNEIPLSRKISGSTLKKCMPYLGSDKTCL